MDAPRTKARGVLLYAVDALSVNPILYGEPQLLHAPHQPRRQHREAKWTDKKRDDENNDAVLYGIHEKDDRAEDAEDRPRDSKDNGRQVSLHWMLCDILA